jgi:DNA replication protein DnaC
MERMGDILARTADRRARLARPDTREPATDMPAAADVQPAPAARERILELPARRAPHSARPAVGGTGGSQHAPAGAITRVPSRDTTDPRRPRGAQLAPPRSRTTPSLREPSGAYTADHQSALPASAPADSGAAPRCPICLDAGYVRLDVPLGDPAFGKPVPCACKERQIEERRRGDLRRLSSLDPFFDKTFDAFDPSIQGVREAFEAARTFAADPEGWLVLSGPHGVGKTHLAAAIANYHLAQGNAVFFSIVPDLLDHLRAAFAPSSELPYDELFDKIREAGLLVLDDLGAENSTAWATEKLFQLINYRYNFRMPTVITTNARLATQMDDRIRSRLSDLSLVRHCVVKAQDYRERHIGPTRRPGGGSGGGARGGPAYGHGR